MAIKWILTCDGECPEPTESHPIVALICPHSCPNSYYERDYPNTELPDDADEREYLNEVE